MTPSIPELLTLQDFSPNQVATIATNINTSHLPVGGVDRNPKFLQLSKQVQHIRHLISLNMPTFLITGATGQQGGATINALLNDGRSDLSIKALTRNPSSTAAQSLSSRGVVVVKGDLSDRESLQAALKGVDAVHLVTDFTGPKGCDGEIEQGKLFVDVAKENGYFPSSFPSCFHSILTQTRHRAHCLLLRCRSRHGKISSSLSE